MRNWDFKKRLSLAVLAALIGVCGNANTTFAVTSSSNNYQITETEFTSGSSQESCSGAYCARVSIGDTAVGESDSATKTAAFGLVTPNEPTLEVIVETGESNLGELSTNRTATKTMMIKVRSYLSDGYTLQIIGDAPKYGGHTLASPTTPTTSQKGKEQFAMNAAANSELGIGADAAQVPSDQMSFGKVEDNYSSANRFMYTSGDTIGRSLSESGRTDYTISMIVNIANSTPAGQYSTDFAAVVIPVY